MSAAGITPITMPKFGLAMTEGKIVSWAKAEGVKVSVGEELADIETSKITNAYESPVEGVLRRHVAPEPVTVEAGGRRLRYLEAGASHEGRPVVLIHGFGGDLNNWLFTQPALAGRHRTIALDLPGHGGSGKEVGAGDPATLAEAVLALLGALDIPKTHLVGHSLGGAVALRIALEHPAHVASLSLIAPAGLGAEIDEAFSRDLIAASRLFVDPALVSRDMAENMLRAKRLDGVQAALTRIREANFGGGRQAETFAARLGELGDIPVQVIWGAEDRIIPAHHAKGLPLTVRAHVLPGAGHMPQMEKAAEVNRLLLDFLSG